MTNPTPTSDDFESLRQVWRIVERRDGAVFRTEYVGEDWVPMGSHGDGADLQYCPLPTSDTRLFTDTVRRRQ